MSKTRSALAQQRSVDWNTYVVFVIRHGWSWEFAVCFETQQLRLSDRSICCRNAGSGFGERPGLGLGWRSVINALTGAVKKVKRLSIFLYGAQNGNLGSLMSTKYEERFAGGKILGFIESLLPESHS